MIATVQALLLVCAAVMLARRSRHHPALWLLGVSLLFPALDYAIAAAGLCLPIGARTTLVLAQVSVVVLAAVLTASEARVAHRRYVADLATDERRQAGEIARARAYRLVDTLREHRVD